MKTVIENIFFRLSEKVSTQGNRTVFALGLLVGSALLDQHFASGIFSCDSSH